MQETSISTPLDLREYVTPKVAEMAGFVLDGIGYIGCYAPDSKHGVELIRQGERYLEDHPNSKVVFTGDFNVHDAEWLCSTTHTDAAGRAAQELCESFGLNQFIQFPTRGLNTLDLVMSPFAGSACAMANPGSSDHVAIAFEMQVISPLQDAPLIKQVHDWEHAPWHHINGAIRRHMCDWHPSNFDSVHEAQVNFNEWMEAIVDRYVPLRDPTPKGCAPWWNFHYEKAYKLKVKAFNTADSDPEKFLRAVIWNKKVQRKAYRTRVYNRKLKLKLDKISN